MPGIKFLNWKEESERSKKKKDLKLCLNHYHYEIVPKRVWYSSINGTARKDGRGWYRGEGK